MTAIEILTRERELLQLRYSAQASILDSLICLLSKNEAPDAAPVPNPVEPPPEIEEPTSNPDPAAQRLQFRATAKRKSPEGSVRGILRQIVAGLPEPFTVPAVAVASGMTHKQVSGALSTWLGTGDLESAGTMDGLKCYKRTKTFPAQHQATRVELAYKEFRGEAGQS